MPDCQRPGRDRDLGGGRRGLTGRVVPADDAYGIQRQRIGRLDVSARVNGSRGAVVIPLDRQSREIRGEFQRRIGRFTIFYNCRRDRIVVCTGRRIIRTGVFRIDPHGIDRRLVLSRIDGGEGLLQGTVFLMLPRPLRHEGDRRPRTIDDQRTLPPIISAQIEARFGIILRILKFPEQDRRICQRGIQTLRIVDVLYQSDPVIDNDVQLFRIGGVIVSVRQGFIDDHQGVHGVLRIL